MKEISVNTEIIKLDSFMKWSGITVLGSEAKMYIQNGEVKVNGEIETKRGKKLRDNDIVEFNGEEYKVKVNMQP